MNSYIIALSGGWPKVPNRVNMLARDAPWALDRIEWGGSRPPNPGPRSGLVNMFTAGSPRREPGAAACYIRAIPLRPTHRMARTVWGESGVAGFFEDVHVLIVVVLGMAILLGSFASAFVAYDAARRRADLRADAADVLRLLLDEGPLLHGGQPHLLDRAAIESLNATGLASLVGPDRPVQLVVAERSGSDPVTSTVSTGPLGEDRAVASTAASVWHGDFDVRTARVTVTLGG